MQRSYDAVDKALRLRLYDPSHFKFWLRDFAATPVTDNSVSRPRAVYERALVDWLKRAQDAAEGGGVAAFYDFNGGWSAGYPETTGYIIATCLEAAERLGDAELRNRARRMADWEVGIQLPEGRLARRRGHGAACAVGIQYRPDHPGTRGGCDRIQRAGLSKRGVESGSLARRASRCRRRMAAIHIQ